MEILVIIDCNWLSTSDGQLTYVAIMTIPYGASSYGLGEQIIDDVPKHNITSLKFMEVIWGIYLGSFIYKTARQYLPRSMALLDAFKEAGIRASKEDKFLTWKTPVGFEVTQYYTTGKVRDVEFLFGNEKLSVRVAHNEIKLLMPSKQKSGAAPNCIHSLDAAHLSMVVAKADFDVTTIHDSYGSLLGDMEQLYHLVKKEMYNLYKDNPLPDLLVQLGIDDIEVDYGTLDIKEVLDSEFCFI